MKIAITRATLGWAICMDGSGECAERRQQNQSLESQPGHVVRKKTEEPDYPYLLEPILKDNFKWIDIVISDGTGHMLVERQCNGAVRIAVTTPQARCVIG